MVLPALICHSLLISGTRDLGQGGCYSDRMERTWDMDGSASDRGEGLLPEREWVQT